jgi:ATP-dependent protease ClpP protease subunit
MDILLTGDIGTNPGEIGSSYVRHKLAEANGQPINVVIHSPGGSVFEGLAMYDLFQAYAGQKRCTIQSAAFSIASLIAMAFPTRAISRNGYLMMHNPYQEDGNEQPKLLKSLRNTMVDIYSAATKKARTAIESMMDAETFLDASESISMGFCNGLIDASPKALARCQALLRSHAGFASHVMARARTKAMPRAATVHRTAPKVSAAVQWKDAIQLKMSNGTNFAKAAMMVEQDFPGLRQQYVAEYNRR